MRNAPGVDKCFRNLHDNILNTRIQQKQFVKDICNEYSLKRNNFNPADKSPNNFVKKLEIRMKLYYENMKN
jgi:hypothetical protein